MLRRHHVAGGVGTQAANTYSSPKAGGMPKRLSSGDKTEQKSNRKSDIKSSTRGEGSRIQQFFAELCSCPRKFTQSRGVFAAALGQQPNVPPGLPICDHQISLSSAIEQVWPISVRAEFSDFSMDQVWHWLCQWSGSPPRITTLAKPVPHTTNGQATQWQLFCRTLLGKARGPF